MKKRVLDITHEEWLKYYMECDLKCNDEKYCPYRIGACCLGDILTKLRPNETLETIIADIEDRVVEV